MRPIVFLDIDNTLLDFDACCRETISRGFRRFGLGEYDAAREQLFHQVNNALWQALECGELSFEELKAVRFFRVFEAMHIVSDGPAFESFFRESLHEVCIPEPGAFELLSFLKGRGYYLCTASNGPYDQQRHRLDLAGMLPYFDQLFISEDIGASKPSPVFFETAFARLPEALRTSFSPSDCTIIGDSLTSDILGGLQAGLHTIWYRRRGAAEREDIIPERTVLSLQEIENIL
ncbi:MAG: HAD-IA family hydrolase [Lachnospiraceae bacterium]|nr:HAD-IA family hydrolase [Lachnospiraceae bacterium]